MFSSHHTPPTYHYWIRSDYYTLRRHVSDYRSQRCRPALALYSWRRSLDECEPTTLKCKQDASPLARLQIQHRQTHSSRCTSRDIHRRRCQLCTGPRCCHRQPVVNGWPRGVGLSLGVLPPATDSTRTTVIDKGRRKDISPGVYFQSPGLLQLGLLRHRRQVAATSAVGAKRSRQTGHADRSARTHLACFARITLATCSTSTGLQARDTHVQVSAWLRPIVSVGCMPVDQGDQSPSSLE